MNRIIFTTIAILSLFILNANEKVIDTKRGNTTSDYHDRSLGYSPYVTIDDCDVLRVYDECADDITVLVCDDNDNPVWSGYPSSTNQQCHEFAITGLDNGRCYTLYLFIDGVTYTGEFTR